MLCSHSSAPGASVASRTVSVFCACAAVAANRPSNSSFETKRMVLSFSRVSGVQQFGGKEVFGRERPREQAVLGAVAQLPLERGPVGGESVGPEVVSHQRARLRKLGGGPGQRHLGRLQVLELGKGQILRAEIGRASCRERG